MTSNSSDGNSRSHLANESSDTFCGLVSRSSPMRSVVCRIQQFARLPIPVLIVGESGTGKDLVARALWRESDSNQPFVVVDCGAIPATLIESELFGHERGAFTGAVRRHTGLLAQADGGILFLDEIAELPLHAQAKLLRAIETGDYRRVGGEEMLRAKVRVIAATHRDLDTRVEEGQFRQDLLFRLGAARILVPPLRERPEDIRSLAEYFLDQFAGDDRELCAFRLGGQALQLLQQYDWPGNVRQLKNVVEAAASMSEGRVVGAEDMAEFLPTLLPHSLDSDGVPTLVDAVRGAEAEAIQRALRETGGRRDSAAALLGISPATLRRKLARLNGACLSPTDQI